MRVCFSKSCSSSLTSIGYENPVSEPAQNEKLILVSFTNQVLVSMAGKYGVSVDFVCQPRILTFYFFRLLSPI